MEQVGIPAEKERHISLKIITPECAKKLMVSGGFIDFDINHKVLDLLQGRKAHCPECKNTLKEESQQQRYYLLKRITCPICGKQPIATKGTVLHNAKITPEELFIIAMLSACNESNKIIAARINKRPGTVREWKNMMEVLTPAYD